MQKLSPASIGARHDGHAPPDIGRAPGTRFTGIAGTVGTVGIVAALTGRASD